MDTVTFLVFGAIAVFVIGLIIWLSAKFGSAFMKVAFWISVRLPSSILLFVLGIALCCTLIGIPLGIAVLKMSGNLLFAL